MVSSSATLEHSANLCLDDPEMLKYPDVQSTVKHALSLPAFLKYCLIYIKIQYKFL